MTHISTKRCQSTEERAKREASSDKTMPIWPAAISLT